MPYVEDQGVFAIQPTQPISVPIPPTPTAWEQFSTGARRQNIIASIIDYGPGGPNHFDPAFKFWDHIKGTDMEPYWESFIEAGNSIKFQQIYDRIRQEQQFQRTMAGSGWVGFSGELVGGIVDPTLLIPGLGLVKSVKGGFSIARTSALSSAMTGGAIAAQEAALHATQLTRTKTESAMGIGFGLVLGGLVGGVAANAYSKAEARVAAAGYNQLNSWKVGPDGTLTGAASGFVDIAPRMGTQAMQPTEAAAFVAHLPPVPPGYARFFHGGEEPTTGGFGRWVSPDPLYARDFRAGDRPNTVHYIDLPKDHPVVKETQMWDDLLDRDNPMMHGRYHSFEVPAELTAGFKPVGTAPPGFVPPAPATAVRVPGQTSGVGSQFVGTVLDKDALTIAGGITRAMAESMRWFNPALRLATNVLVKARDMGTSLGEIAFHFKGGETQDVGGAAIETLMRSKYSARMGASVTGTDKIFKDARKLGLTMGRREFNSEIGKAMRNGDTHPIPAVQEAAELWRKQLVDPIFNEAVAEGILKEEMRVTVKGAQSYFSRWYDQAILNAREGEFKTIVNGKVLPWIKEIFAKQKEALDAQIKELEDRKMILNLKGEARADMMADIEAGLQRVDLDHPEAVKVLDEIDQWTKAKLMLEKQGNEFEAKKAADAADRLRKFHAKQLEAYRAEKRGLERTRKLLESGYEGAEEKIDKLINDLIDIDERNLKKVQQLVNKGRQMERELSKVQTPEEKDAVIDKWSAEFTKAAESFYAARDKIVDSQAKIEGEFFKAEQKVKQAMAADKPNLEQIKIQQQANEAARAKMAPTLRKMERAAATLEARGKRMFDTADRLNNAKAFDIDEARTAILESAEKLKGETIDMISRRATRAERLREKIGELSPENVKKLEAAITEKQIKATLRMHNKWGSNMAPDFNGISKDLVDQYFDKISGRKHMGEESWMREWESPIDRGPMRGRVDLPILDKDVENFLHNDVQQVMDRYARQMIADIELTKRLGSPQMYTHVDELRQEAQAVREAIIGSTDAGQIGTLADLKKGRNEDIETFRQRALIKLSTHEKEAVEDVQAGRDMLRGMYKVPENQGTWGRIVTASNQFQYILKSGRFMISSMGDIFRPGFVHGLSLYMSHGLPALLRNIDGVKLARAESKMAGLGHERALHARTMSMMEVGDPLGHGTTVERLLRNGTAFATWANRLGAIQDVGEEVASAMAQHKIYTAIMQGNNPKYLGLLNIDKKMEGEIKAQLQAHSKKVDQYWIANTDSWTNAEAVDAYRGALYKDVASMVPKPGMFDKPLAMQLPFFKAFFQFRSYSMAANQRVMMRGMQEDRANFVAQMVGLTTVGMFVSYLKAVGNGREYYEKWLDQAQNPGFLIGEGLDNSGLLPLIFEASNNIEKMTKQMGFTFNPVKSPMKMAFGGNAEVEGSKYYDTDFLRAIAGPTFGFPEDVMRLGHASVKALRGDALNRADKRSFYTMAPYNTFYGIREIIQVLHDDSVYWKQ